MPKFKRINPIKRAVVRTLDALKDAVNDLCAPLEVRCVYGTSVCVWSMQEAMQWLPKCADIAMVVHRATGDVLAMREIH